jgi:hypothetical protein
VFAAGMKYLAHWVPVRLLKDFRGLVDRMKGQEVKQRLQMGRKRPIDEALTKSLKLDATKWQPDN